VRDEKLHGFSADHLHYEINMCRKTLGLLAGGTADGVLKDVLVESYAIHLRALIEFLYDPRRNPDDLRAGDFVKVDAAWLRARGAKPKALTDAQKRAHKQIAHFTKKRFAYGTPEKNWMPGYEIPALVAGLRLFLQHADPAKLHPIVSEAVGGLASLVSAEAEEAP
jgi:hypothetical protein